jgi:hypothetical protein
MSHHRVRPDHRTISDVHIRQNFGACSNPDIIANNNLANLRRLLTDRSAGSHPVVVIDDLHLGTHQHIISQPYEILGSDHAVSADDRVVANDHPRIGFGQLKEGVILDRAIIANFQYGIVGQPEFGVVFNNHTTSATR